LAVDFGEIAKLLEESLLHQVVKPRTALEEEIAKLEKRELGAESEEVKLDLESHLVTLKRLKQQYDEVENFKDTLLAVQEEELARLSKIIEGLKRQISDMTKGEGTVVVLKSSVKVDEDFD